MGKYSDYSLELAFNQAIELEKLKGMEATPEGVIAAADLFAKWFKDQKSQDSSDTF